MAQAKLIERKARPIATALLLAMAFVQLAEFAHQSEHSLADGAERCATCVQLDQFGNGASTAMASIALDLVADVHSLPPQPTHVKHSHRAPSARAPPLA